MSKSKNTINEAAAMRSCYENKEMLRNRRPRTGILRNVGDTRNPLLAHSNVENNKSQIDYKTGAIIHRLNSLN